MVEREPDTEPPHVYECFECGNREEADSQPVECDECGGRMHNVSKPRSD